MTCTTIALVIVVVIATSGLVVCYRLWGEAESDCRRAERERDYNRELADLAHSIAWSAAETSDSDYVLVSRVYTKRVAEIVNARAATQEDDGDAV